MALIRWNPFGEIDTFQRQMNRLFEDCARPEASVTGWTPRVDTFEDENQITVSAELPGLSDKDVTVNVENNVLTISGERAIENEENKDGYTRVERLYGSFDRSFSLPNTVDIEKVDAKMDKGVLTVTLPRREETKPKQIEVKVH
jgi:HSP20 family protein